jgi:hypothetical protein
MACNLAVFVANGSPIKKYSDLDLLAAIAAGICEISGGSSTLVVSGSSQDNGPAWATSRKVVTSGDLSGAAVDATDAPTAGQKIVATDLIVSSDTALTLTFTEETSATVLLKLYVPASGVAQITPRSKLKLDTANKKLQVQSNIAGNVGITTLYYSEA